MPKGGGDPTDRPWRPDEGPRSIATWKAQLHRHFSNRCLFSGVFARRRRRPPGFAKRGRRPQRRRKQGPAISQGQTVATRRKRQMRPRTKRRTMVLVMVGRRLVGRRRQLHDVGWRLDPGAPPHPRCCPLLQADDLRPRLVPCAQAEVRRDDDNIWNQASPHTHYSLSMTATHWRCLLFDDC